MSIYHWQHIRVDEDTDSEPATDFDVWGRFAGLFGLESNERFLMLHSRSGDLTPPSDRHGVEVVDSLALAPTVRPATFEPMTASGLFVFRFFDVDGAHIDEVVQLSDDAWATFENTDEYDTRPVGLFRPASSSTGRQRMLLVTWYDGFTSWERSRAPAPEAREHFRRRRELTRGTIAYATRLV